MSGQELKPVGTAGPMPGTSAGFTMECFKSSEVPVGTALYAGALAAAAPDLLAALQILLECASYGDVIQNADAWDTARAAIAKATGK